ncbi:toll/interleukin-1 receptor domain-containing protein [Pseudomonas sp. CFA]|nr:toll/interleukin-1 receptor domain-containing protein [Pseudomonas sp. CFA]
MPINQADLLNAGQRRSMQGRFSKRLGQPTAFLSHSHKDATLALGLQELLNNHGWDVYIDWQDQTMPEKPASETATTIKTAIIRADWFLFLATQNSMASHWCPWEIGFADGKKTHERIANVPTQDSFGHYHGNEYLNLYNKIDMPNGMAGLAFFDTRGNGKWVSFL